MSEIAFPLIEAVIKMRPVVFYPAIAQVIGIKEAIFCSQILYWTPRARNEEGWVYKSAEEIEVETALGYEEQRRIRKRLIEIGILEERYDRPEHRMYFRINRAFMDKMISKAIAQRGEALKESPDAVLVEHLAKAQQAPGESSDAHSGEVQVALGRSPVRVPESTAESTSRDDTIPIRPPRKRLKGEGDFSAVKDTWCRLFRVAAGTDYALSKRDEKQLKEVYKVKGVDGSIRAIEIFFRDGIGAWAGPGRYQVSVFLASVNACVDLPPAVMKPEERLSPYHKRLMANINEAVAMIEADKAAKRARKELENGSYSSKQESDR